MTRRVVTGFEPGNAAGWTVGNAGNRFADAVVGTAPTIVSTSPRNGTYCLQVAPSAASSGLRWTTDTLTASQNRILMAFGLYFPSTVPTAQIVAQDVISAGLNWIAFTDASDRLCAGFEGGNTTTGPTLSADTWYWVEVYCDHSANPHVLRWWVGGTERTQVTQGQAAATISNVSLGTTNSETYTARFDDLIIDAHNAAITVPLGPHKVVLLKPDTGGTCTEIGTANATGRMVTNSAVDATHNHANILAAISEVPFVVGASASGVGQRTSGAGNAVGVPMTSYALQSGESITDVRIETVGWAATSTAAFMGLRHFNGTVERTLQAGTVDPNFDSTSTPAWLCRMATAGDFDTQAELDAMILRVGYSTDVNPLIGYHALYAEAAIKLAGGQTEAVGQATETDTATALTRQKSKVLGLATSVEVAHAITRQKVRQLGQAVEADAAFAVARRKVELLGQAAETDTATHVATGPIRVNLGQAAETDTATALTHAKREAVGQASEADTATTLGRAKRESVGQASEADTATALTRRKLEAVGQAAETDTATALGRQHRRAVGQAAETDTAQPVTERKGRNVGQATETDTATALGRRKQRLVGQALEVDTAGAISTPGAAKLIGQAVEVDGAQPVTERKLRTTGQASETDTAGALTRQHRRAVGQASEADTATALTRAKREAVGQAAEADTATALGRRKLRPLGQASEIDVATAVTGPGIVRVIGTALEVDVAFAIAAVKAIGLVLVAEGAVSVVEASGGSGTPGSEVTGRSGASEGASGQGTIALEVSGASSVGGSG